MNHMRIYILLLLTLSFPAMGDICSTDKNVKDYFLSIPHTQLRIADDERGYLTSEKDRNKAIEILDIKNGFLELQNNTIISRTQIVLFRAKEKRPVILVNSDGVSVQNVYAFICTKDKWVNVTNILFPKLSYQEIAKLYNSKNALPGKTSSADTLEPVAHTLVRYKLPRFGKKIRAYASHPDINNPEETILFEFEPELGRLSWD